ncbi:MAG: hypothetical protein K2I40_00465, partial [Bifidobacterium castoris]|nr:hypothetical protein [Bifidobacterium castoris]
MNAEPDQVVERIAALPSVRQAAQEAADLTELWPLTSALHMDNDARYCENLQVRLSRLAAQVMTGETIPMADAEFVYEGADAIPGRPQSTVDALNAANDAVEALEGFISSHDVHGLLDAAGTLDAGWSGATSTAVTAAIGDLEDFVAARAETKVESPAWHYAVVVALLNL